MKWKKLRDSYRDALKRQSEMLARDPSNQCKKNYPWKYTGHMQFLQPYMSNRKKPAEASPSTRNGHAATGPGGGGSDSSESESEPEPPPAKRRSSTERLSLIDRKLDYLCQQRGKRRLEEMPPAPAPPRDHSTASVAAATAAPATAPAPALPPDPLDIFFNSMCQSTKRFSFQTQIKIKRSLFEAVVAAEEELITEQQSYASLWAGGAASSSASSEPDVKPC